MSLDEQMKMLEEDASKIEQVQKINGADLQEPSQTEKWAAQASSRGPSSVHGSIKTKIVQNESDAPDKKTAGDYERKKPAINQQQLEEARK